MTEKPTTLSGVANIYKLLVDSVRDYAIIALDKNGRVATWNPGAQRFKQYSADEIVGQSYSTFFTAEDVAAGKPDQQLEVAEREGRVETEGWLLRKDGSCFWGNVVITALRDEAGQFAGYAEVTRDLTSWRLATAALRESEERFRLIVQSVKDYGIFMLDPTGRIVSWNAGAERIKGYTANDIIGRHFSTFYPQVDRDAKKPEFELEVAAREGRFEDEGWRIRKDGTRFWANVIITALRDERGELVGFAKVTRDLTERRAAEEKALADMKRVTESDIANRAKSEFLMAMSHELRTPLNAIGGYTELLALGLGGTVTDQQREYLARIGRSQKHLMALINDILNFSRVESGHVEYERSEVSLASVIGTVVPLIEPQAWAKHLKVTQQNGPDAVACADRGKVEQILINLLSNAVKYTDEGGTIDLAYSMVEERAQVRVSDTGVGIPAEHLTEIFEPFTQVGRTLTNPSEGTGLGLAISRDLARAMGGDLTVESVVGAGTTFTLSLPGE